MFEEKICLTREGQKIKICDLTDSHLINRINYFKRMLDTYPGMETYVGESDAAESAVDCENRYNEILYEDITKHLKKLKKEAKKRIIVL